MIVRELKENPDEVLANFDWFNDYKDTRAWARFSFPEILERLDTGFELYRISRDMLQPDINRDWKANAQANAAALNIVFEYVSVEFGGVPAGEHLPECGADPVNVAKAIVEALVAHKEGLS